MRLLDKVDLVIRSKNSFETPQHVERLNKWPINVCACQYFFSGNHSYWFSLYRYWNRILLFIKERMHKWKCHLLDYFLYLRSVAITYNKLNRSHKKRKDCLETRGVYIKVAMVSWNLSNDQKRRIIFKKHGLLWRGVVTCRCFSSEKILAVNASFASKHVHLQGWSLKFKIYLGKI